jgi:hypothetical protein
MTEKRCGADWLIEAVGEVNLASKLEPDELSHLGSEVVQMYNLDRSHRAEWDQQSESAIMHKWVRRWEIPRFSAVSSEAPPHYTPHSQFYLACGVYTPQT